jgi:hypothetical protein
MATTLNSQVASLPLPKVNFTWDPVGAAITFNFAGNSYPPAGSRFEAFYTPVNQLITFTAAAVPASGTAIVQYRWDMGDGVTKFGAVIGHTYTVPNQSLTAKLEVTDSLNRKVYVSKAMLLQVQFPTQVSNKARV